MSVPFWIGNLLYNKEKTMENYISINVQKIELTAEQVKQIAAAHNRSVRLSTVSAGEVVKIGEHEMIVLEQSGDTTGLIRKDLLPQKEKFGTSNNYDGAHVDCTCNKFAEEITAVVGEKNIVLHTVDLTSDDGLKDYGKVRRKASLLTCDRYRRYVDILDQFKPDTWWWLATAFSTKKHDGESWVKCVTPSGYLFYDHYNFSGDGVRPFCILKSDIFVSR